MFNPNNDRTNEVGRETNITVAKQNQFCSFELTTFSISVATEFINKFIEKDFDNRNENMYL